MCHGYIDPHFLLRETEERLREGQRSVVAEPAPQPQPATLPGLIAALRRLFTRRPDPVPAE